MKPDNQGVEVYSVRYVPRRGLPNSNPARRIRHLVVTVTAHPVDGEPESAIGYAVHETVVWRKQRQPASRQRMGSTASYAQTRRYLQDQADKADKAGLYPAEIGNKAVHDPRSRGRFTRNGEDEAFRADRWVRPGFPIDLLPEDFSMPAQHAHHVDVRRNGEPACQIFQMEL